MGVLEVEKKYGEGNHGAVQVGETDSKGPVSPQSQNTGQRKESFLLVLRRASERLHLMF